MSHEDAVAAIEAAANADAGVTPEAPAPAAEPIQPEAPATPEGSEPAATPAAPARDEQGRFTSQPDTPEAPSEDSFASSFDPNTLAPELLPAYKQMQADYTRKTQLVSERAKQLEELGDPEALQTAVQLYQRIQDPRQWPTLHTELSEAMQQMGLSPAEAGAAATQTMQDAAATQAPAEGAPDLASLLREDPELKPLLDYVRTLESKVSEIDNSIQSQREAEEAQRMHMALVGELQRQEHVLRNNHPSYEQEDVDMNYELSSFFNGNLIQANERLEQYVQSRIQRYFDQKATVQAGTGPQPASSPGALTTEPPEKPKTLDEAHDAAMAYLRQVEAADT